MDQAQSGLDSCGLGFLATVNLLTPPCPSVRIDVKMRYEFPVLIGGNSIDTSTGDLLSAQADSVMFH